MSLFGDAPEDNEGGAVVRRAIETMKKLGAETVDVTIPALDQLLNNTSVIDAEFKFDLMDYLARVPDAPVRSLSEIVEQGLYHSAIEASVKRRNAVESRDTDAYRRARIRRETLRQAVLAAMEEQRVVALAYPTMRRKAAPIGQPQPGATCQLSASTGLPALSLPAGFTEDGLPIGLELLGRAFDEGRLLGLAYGFEQAAPVRKPPFSAPALSGRHAPAPIDFVSTAAGSGATLTVRFTFDGLTGELRFQAAASGVPAQDVVAAWIQRGAEGERGAALFQILARGESDRSGTLQLTPTQHELLRSGKFYLAFYWRGASARAQIRVP